MMVTFRLTGTCQRCSATVEGFKCVNVKVRITKLISDGGLIFFKPCCGGRSRAILQDPTMRLDPDDAPKVEAARVTLRARYRRQAERRKAAT